MARRENKAAGSWQKIRNHRQKVLGRVRRLSGAFDADQRWEVEGLDGVVFEDWFEAHKYLLENDGVRWQVKTELSHRYWDGTKMGAEMDRDAGRVYAREGDAEKLARKFDTGKSWDRVCVAAYRPDNFGK